MDIQTTKDHKAWISKKLKQYGIDKEYLLGLTIIVERCVYDEQRKTNAYAPKPFYLLYKEGKRTRAWLHMAELALFCKHRDYRPAEYVRSVCSLPEVKRFFYNKDQIPMNLISPSTRIGASHLRKREGHFLRRQYDGAYKKSL